MTLSIRPVRLKRSIYFRVPNDIVDLINLEDNSQVTLTLEEKDDRHLLVYSVLKNNPLGTRLAPEIYPINETSPTTTNRRALGRS